MPEEQQKQTGNKLLVVLRVILPIFVVSLLISYNSIHFLDIDTTALEKVKQSIILPVERENKTITPNVGVAGIVIDDNGEVVEGATITLESFGKDRIVVRSSDSGTFTIPVENITHSKIIVSAEHYRTEILHMVLSSQHKQQKGVAQIDPIILPSHNPNAVRMIFGGDVAFGRKWIDPLLEEQSAKTAIPKDHPDAFIQPSDPEPGTKRALQCVAPWFQEADFRSVNWETPVTNNPRTPNKQKIITFFTLPGSLNATKDALNVSYLALGNNHIYDYMQDGLKDTLDHIDQLNIPHSGAGLDAAHAITPYRTTLSPKHTKYSFLSLTSIGNIAAKNNETYNTFATSNKGGAAGIYVPDKNALPKAISKELKDGYIPIPQLHVGIEYVSEPSEVVRKKSYMKTVTDLGVPLVIMHHPHIAKGMAMLKKTPTSIKNDGSTNKDQRTVVLMSIGNMALDSDHIECLLSIVGRIDMSEDGTQVDRVRLLPIYLENYAPKPIGGALASRLIRHLSQQSHDFYGRLYSYNGMGYANLGKGHDDAVRKTRSVIVDVTVPPSSTESTVIDLRKWMETDESLLAWAFHPHVRTRKQFSVQVGRDIYGFGDFEDYVIDTFEERSANDAIKARWDLGKYGQACMNQYVFRGSASLCSSISLSSSKQNKNTTSTSPKVITSEIINQRKIRVEGALTTNPNKNLTLLGYVAGNNAGSISIKATYHVNAVTSNRKTPLGEDLVFQHDGGTFDWMTFAMDLNMPKDVVKSSTGPERNFINARALKIGIHHSVNTTTTSSSQSKGETSSTSSGRKDALVALDEIAVISWDEGKIASGDELRVPHAYDFLKVKAAEGTYKLKLTFVRYIPAAASGYLDLPEES